MNTTWNDIKVWFLLKNLNKPMNKKVKAHMLPSLVAHTCTPSTQEAKVANSK